MEEKPKKEVDLDKVKKFNEVKQKMIESKKIINK